MTATANIPLGATATQQIEVVREMTVAHFHEHMPEVYGTPIMIYHLEVTAEEAIRRYLPEGWMKSRVTLAIMRPIRREISHDPQCRVDRQHIPAACRCPEG